MAAKRKVQPSANTNNTVNSIQNGGIIKRNFPLTKLRREKIKFFTEQTKNNIERFGLPGTYRWIIFLTKFIKSPNVDEQVITSWLEREPSLINAVSEVHPAAAQATTTQRYNIRSSSKAAILPYFEVPENWFNILERLDLNSSDSLPTLEKMAVYETTIKNVQKNCQPSTSAGLRRLSEHDNKFENGVQIKMPELQLMEKPIQDEQGWRGTGTTEGKGAAEEESMHTAVCQEISTPLDMAIFNRARPYCMPIYNLSPTTSPYFCELRQHLPFEPTQNIFDQSTNFNTDIETSQASAVEIFQTEATKKFLDDRKMEEIVNANEAPSTSTSKSEHTDRYSNILDNLRSIQQRFIELTSIVSLPKPQLSQDSNMDEDIDVGMELIRVPSPKPIAPASAELSKDLLPTHPVCLRALRSAVGENYIDLQIIAILENSLTALIAIKETIQDIINSIENITISHDISHKL